MNRLFLAQFFVEVLGLAALTAVLPRIGRRGLLFGVHVGAAGWSSAEARAITASWYRSMVFATAAGVGLFALVTRWASSPAGFLAGSLALFLGSFLAYARCHRAARHLAVDAVPPAVALLDEEPRPGLGWPLATFAIVLLAVAGMVTYSARHYAGLPERIPVHFDFAGNPDGWAAKSPVQILLLPAMTLILGGFLGCMALMLLKAKRGLRHPGTAGSAEAGRRFRVATSRFLCGITIATTAMLTTIQVGQVRTAMGQAFALGPLLFVFVAGMMALSLGGVIYLMARYGQAGARIEEAGGAAVGELTDGIADNRLWKWGLFYVNREDPAVFVEKRFGFGYTINLGNPKAIALFGAFSLAIVAIVVAALVTS